MSDSPYAIPRQRVDWGRVTLPIHVGWWRSIHSSHNGFFRESFLDELAHHAGRDPVDYRRALLRDSPRDLAVSEVAIVPSNEPPGGVGEVGLPPFPGRAGERDLRRDRGADPAAAGGGSAAEMRTRDNQAA